MMALGLKRAKMGFPSTVQMGAGTSTDSKLRINSASKATQSFGAATKSMKSCCGHLIAMEKCSIKP